MNTTILVTGFNEKDINTVKSGINIHNCEIIEALSTEAAIEKLYQYNIDVVIIGKDVLDEDVKKLTKIFTLQNPDIIIVNDTGDTNISQIITTALNEREAAKKPSVSLIDDALKNAGLKINIQ